jgi:hypothetical protein
MNEAGSRTWSWKGTLQSMQNFLVWTLDCFFDLGIVGIEEDGFSLDYVRILMMVGCKKLAPQQDFDIGPQNKMPSRMT